MVSYALKTPCPETESYRRENFTELVLLPAFLRFFPPARLAHR